MRPLSVILSSTALLGLVCLLFTGAVTVAIIETQRSQRAAAIAVKAAAAFASDQAKAKTVAEELAAVEERRTALDRASAQLRREPGDGANSARAGANPPSAPDGRGPRASAEELSDGARFIATSVQARTTLMEIGRAQIAAQYAPFYRKVGLTPEQIQAFENATAAHWLENIAMSPNNIHPSDPTLAEGPLRALLGDSGYQQYQEFTHLQPAANVTRQMSMGMSASGDTMTTAQMDQVTQIIANNSPSYQSGGSVNPNTVDWPTVFTQAAAVVTPQQAAALRATMTLLQTQQALNAAARAAEAPPPTAPSPASPTPAPPPAAAPPGGL